MNNVIIYSKDYCPYCKNAKKILSSKGISYQEIDVEFDNQSLKEMITRSGRRTVPQIFFGQQHIGGHDDLVRYFSQQAPQSSAA